MINNVVLVGRLTKDPELMKTQSNISYVRFTLAVNRSFADQSGERQADFINCIAWRNQAENLARFMKQGSQIGLQGRIQTGSYETDQGTRYTTDVVADSIQFLESKTQKSNDNNDEFSNLSGSIITDNDLPF
ncbi:single-stranded DNA-binding protein [Haploplasma modicum]|jgi:single-strand DNA-binding protein|uniref:single-stranded DNA-binding protein n=1 Tax=Haploplasma modicum TaxID=2150 RepID=UPI00047A05B3|nr:single-stranded DNA-binding protein [Haploplasma modicum]